jgi:ubiquinone/menaquinone biosynthesis C-methylase UbiE
MMGPEGVGPRGAAAAVEYRVARGALAVGRRNGRRVRFMANSTTRTSAEETIERFDTPQAAAKYAASLGGTATHRREMRCILDALATLPAGATVLDLPCGTGRLLPELSAKRYRVVEADSSPHMVELARQHAARRNLPDSNGDFVVASVFQTPFSNDQFDAVVCNRLFHHFREAQVRRNAMKELKRICRGPIVASFFCNSSIDGVVFHVKQALKRKKATDRIPIARSAFEADVRAVGLRVTRWMAIRPGVSKQWYAVLERA